jgi:hypothetical protein
MAERRRRSVYRTKTVEMEALDAVSPKKVFDYDDESATSPGSGYKRRRSSTKKETSKQPEKEDAKDDKPRKVRHTMSGAKSSDKKQVSDHLPENKERSSKHRRTVDFSQHVTSDDNSTETKRNEQSKERKSSSTSRQSSTLSRHKDDNQSTKTAETAKSSDKERKSVVQDLPNDAALPAPKSGAKGKGRAPDAQPAEPSHSSKSTRSSVPAEPTDKGKGKAKAVAPAPDVPDYEDMPAASRLHEEVPTDMPESRRLQRLIELAIEAEQAQMAHLYTGQCSWISRFAAIPPRLSPA